mmetsp:Transcript_14194/g.29818  ORF Transcript_14194/g.29818 Transcript_14194/m.29818 type:complete len:650 (-) Transcript_14194:19-1968(-)
MGASPAEAGKQFATDLKWLLWNDLWFAVNTVKAWLSNDNSKRQQLLGKAAQDGRRGESHLLAAEKALVVSAETLHHCRACAQAAGKETGTAALNGGKVTNDWLNDAKLKEGNKHASSEMGVSAWESVLETLRRLAKYAAASLIHDKQSKALKAAFEQQSETLYLIPRFVEQQKGQLAAKGDSDDRPPSFLPPPRTAERPRQEEVEEFDQRELNIWEQTEGAFCPKRTPPNVGRGRVSVVSPTVERRQDFHQILWSCFEAQDWPDKELIIVETYTKKPSEFFTEMAKKEPRRLVYVSYQKKPDDDWSIGLKRNIGASLATGEFIANFDDDDLYSPSYLSTLVEHLQKQKNCVGVKLSSWFIFYTAYDKFGYSNPEQEANMMHRESEVEVLDKEVNRYRSWLYGYGFSYVHKRQAVLDFPYADICLGEDYDFFTRLMQAKGDGCIALMNDTSGLCLHAQHANNTATDFALWEVPAESMSDLEFLDFYPVFGWHRRLCLKQRDKMLRSMLASPPKEDDVFAYSMTRSAPKRFRDIKVHGPRGVVEVRCRAGATVTEVLESFEQLTSPLPASVQVYRVPPKSEVRETLYDDWVQRVLRNLSPIAPNLSVFRSASSELDDDMRVLLSRAEEPMEFRHRVGTRTTDLWVHTSPRV